MLQSRGHDVCLLPAIQRLDERLLAWFSPVSRL